MDALDLLTENCWKEILKRVKDPKDLWSCSEACLTFQEILRRKRNEFMFHVILPHILEYLPAPDIPRNNKLQQWKALLKPRLVCKCWATSIDKLRDAEHQYVFENAYLFTCGEGIEQFLQKFANHSRNPFLGRIVFFELRPTSLLLAGNQALIADRGTEEDNEAFYIRKFHRLLERFGTEMWTFRRCNSGDILPFYRNIQMELSHLPNMRTLQLQDSFRGNFELDQGRMTELTTYMAANPLPPLPLLKTLWTSGVHFGMTQLILAKYAPQLKSLMVRYPSGVLFPEQGLRLPNLVVMFLGDLDASLSLQGLKHLQSTVRSLGLEVGHNENGLGVWPIDKLFRNIGHLPIRRLTIWVANVFLGESGPTSAKERPYHGSISSVDLRVQRGGASFNFLLYCPELTSVAITFDVPQPEIEVSSGHPDGISGLLDVSELLEQDGRNFYQSNIWDNLHHLRMFKLDGNRGWDYYKRDEYERRKLDRGRAAAAAGERL